MADSGDLWIQCDVCDKWRNVSQEVYNLVSTMESFTCVDLLNGDCSLPDDYEVAEGKIIVQPKSSGKKRKSVSKKTSNKNNREQVTSNTTSIDSWIQCDMCRKWRLLDGKSYDFAKKLKKFNCFFLLGGNCNTVCDWVTNHAVAGELVTNAEVNPDIRPSDVAAKSIAYSVFRENRQLICKKDNKISVNSAMEQCRLNLLEVSSLLEKKYQVKFISCQNCLKKRAVPIDSIFSENFVCEMSHGSSCDNRDDFEEFLLAHVTSGIE